MGRPYLSQAFAAVRDVTNEDSILSPAVSNWPTAFEGFEMQTPSLSV